ncbi:MAG: hypothetical protein COA38_17885 [Fluviicola sp.]|nr:MAG: hypothetical protein COA38_17885 [Fluviicola sp.]
MRLPYIAAVAGLLLANISSFGQSGAMSKANGFYNKLDYFEASQMYIDLLGSGEDDSKMKLRLADCFYQIGDSENAEKYYSKVIEEPEAKSDDIYQYSQSLKENGKYDKSDTYMDKFTLMEGDDARADLFQLNKSYLEDIENLGPFYEVSAAKFNSADKDFGGYVLNDKIYFVSNRRNRMMVSRSHNWDGSEYLDIYCIDKQEGSEVKRLRRSTNSKFHEGPLCFSPDGQRVYFTRNNILKGKSRRDEDGIQNLKLYTAFIDGDGKLTEELELNINSNDYSVGHPTISSDGKTIYFVSNMPGGFGGADIYKGEIDSNGDIQHVRNLGSSINTEGQEMFPWIDNDQNLYFSSDGHVGLGGLDVFVASLLSNGEIGFVLNAGTPVNSKKDDFGFIISQSQNSGYLSSNRKGGKGDDDIYLVKVIRDFDFGVILNGTIADSDSKEILPGAIIRLLDANGSIVFSTISDENGNYAIPLNRDEEYVVSVEKIGYTASNKDISMNEIPSDVNEIKKDFVLDGSAEFSLQTMVTNAKTGEPLEGVRMVIINNVTGDVVDYTTSSTGDYSKELYNTKLSDKLNYTLELSKEGFRPTTLNYDSEFTKSGVYSIYAQMNPLEVVLSELGTETMLEINAIYFDLNSSLLSTEAKQKLDVIVKVMNANPELEIELGSHTDCRQTRKYNLWLSQKRADNSANYIMKRISKPERITFRGYGESRLLNDCECEPIDDSNCPEVSHRENRRTEFRVLNPGSLRIKNNSPNSFGLK